MDTNEFLLKAFDAAKQSGHVWPDYAACEAALESGWGESQLAKKANNLFGLKQPSDPSAQKYPVISIPTREFVDGEFVLTSATWPVYPDWQTSFSERMATLKRVHLYEAALAAYEGESFVKLVSIHWSTDPRRAEKVLMIHQAHCPVFQSSSIPNQ